MACARPWVPPLSLPPKQMGSRLGKENQRWRDGGRSGSALEGDLLVAGTAALSSGSLIFESAHTYIGWGGLAESSALCQVLGSFQANPGRGPKVLSHVCPRAGCLCGKKVVAAGRSQLCPQLPSVTGCSQERLLQQHLLCTGAKTEREGEKKKK